MREIRSKVSVSVDLMFNSFLAEMQRYKLELQKENPEKMMRKLE